MNPLAFST